MSLLFISSRSIFLLSSARQAYAIYANTKGMKMLTHAIVRKVNSLEHEFMM